MNERISKMIRAEVVRSLYVEIPEMLCVLQLLAGVRSCVFSSLLLPTTAEH